MSESVPKNMFAWIYKTHGKPEEVLHKLEVPVPTPSPSQVLVQVKSAALNPIGYKSMNFFPSFMVKKPCIAEMDVAGIVAGVGASVASFKVGDEVYGIIPGEVNMKTGHGALAQYTVVEEQHLVPKPSNISWQEAAGVSLVALTSYDSLVVYGKLKSEQRIFINGGSGGVGTVGVQMAKAYGAYVVASCSTDNVDFVKQQGADEVIDYKVSDLHTQLKEKFHDKPFDIIYDTIGSDELFHHCESYLKKDGPYVQVGAPIASFGGMVHVGLSMAKKQMLPGFLGGVSRSYKQLLMTTSKQYLEAINQLVQQDRLRPPVDSTYDFDNVHAAYARIMSHRAKGKIVVNIS